MFHNILVPVDLSDKNAAAVEKGAELAAPGSSPITLLHIIETIRDVPYDELEEFYRSLRERAEDVLDRWATELSDKGLTVRREIVFGRRGPEIVRYAEEQGCDLIVLTSHPIDRDHPGESFGTISHQVALLASCPVLLMR